MRSTPRSTPRRRPTGSSTRRSAAALESAGYDRDFSLLGDRAEPAGPAVPSRLAEVRLDGLILRRPPGLALDLNGVVKSLAVDEAAGLLSGDGFVSAGGDVAVRGPVDVGLPGGGAVRVLQGGLATSGVATRSWRRGGEEQHHLVDPRTGRPSTSRWQQVTVSGASCLAADVAAKAAFLLGDDGPDWLDARGLPGRFVARDGSVEPNGSWRRRNRRRGRVHLTSSPAIWYAARASGVAAYVVLTIVVCLGIGLAGKAQSHALAALRRRGRPSLRRAARRLADRHPRPRRSPSTRSSRSRSTQLLVPFTATYRPLWTGLGIAAAELLLALAIANHYRNRLPYRVWRSAHYLNFAVWGAASVHGMFSGTDRSATWLAVLYGVGVASVLVLLVWRVGGFALRSPAAAGAGAVAVVALPVLMLLGPLQKNVRPWNAAKLSEPLTGQVIRNGTQLKEIVSFVGSGDSPQKLLVRADLLVSPQALDATSLQLEYLPSGDVCRGRVTQIGGTSFAGRCVLPSGAARWVDASWVPRRRHRCRRHHTAACVGQSRSPSRCRACCSRAPPARSRRRLPPSGSGSRRSGPARCPAT